MIVTVLIVLVIFLLFPPNKKADNYLLVVSDAVGITKYDVNNGVSLKFPESPNYKISPIIIFFPILMYLFIRSAASLVDDRCDLNSV